MTGLILTLRTLQARENVTQPFSIMPYQLIAILTSNLVRMFFGLQDPNSVSRYREYLLANWLSFIIIKPRLLETVKLFLASLH